MSLPPEIIVEVILSPGTSGGVGVIDQPLEVTVARVLPGPPGPQGPPGQDGATTFLALTDTPATFAGNAARLVRVNTSATGLEFRAPEDVRADIGAAGVVHSHTIADVSGLQASLDGKASLVHSHTVADVSGLQVVLDGKAPLVHTHSPSEIVGLIPPSQLAQAGATVGQVLAWNGAAWVPATVEFVSPTDIQFLGVGLLWEDGVAVFWVDETLALFEAPEAVLWQDGLLVAWEDQAVVAW